MSASGNPVRFFGPFNFLNLGANADSMRNAPFFSLFGRGASNGTTCAYDLIMLDRPENMNAQNPARLTEVTAAHFKSEVLDSEQPALVGFWSPWSRPCQVLESVLEELALTCAGKMKVLKVNADDSLDLSLWYDIQSVPTLLYFVQGQPRLRIVGTASKEAILAKLQPFSD